MNSTANVGPMASESPLRDLHDRLNELLEKNHNKSKPWLGWPTTWEGLRLSHDQTILREYLTSPDIHRGKLEEVRSTMLALERVPVAIIQPETSGCENDEGTAALFTAPFGLLCSSCHGVGENFTQRQITAFASA